MNNFNINLYHRQITSPTEKLIYFALHYLRYIIVLTQIVVIAVFFARFQLDQEIIDLKEKIGQKQEIIKVTRPLVEQAKSMSMRINKASGYLVEQEKFMEVFEFVTSNVPQTVTLSVLDISKSKINIQGNSEDLRSIVFFTKRLQGNERLSSIKLDNIEKQDLDNFEFKLSN